MKRNDDIIVACGVGRRRVLDIICNAMDSGAFAYWIDRRTLQERWPLGTRWPDDSALDDVAWLTDEDRTFFRDARRCYFAPLVEGGALTFCRDDDDSATVGLEPRVCVLDLGSIASGLAVMQRDYPRHFADLVSGDDDATTADVFVQCCVLGEVVYG